MFLACVNRVITSVTRTLDFETCHQNSISDRPRRNAKGAIIKESTAMFTKKTKQINESAVCLTFQHTLPASIYFVVFLVFSSNLSRIIAI